LGLPIYLHAAHAASNGLGSLYRSPWTMIAQAIRAILLASATAATLVGRPAINRPSHGRFSVPCDRTNSARTGDLGLRSQQRSTLSSNDHEASATRFVGKPIPWPVGLLSKDNPA
jgi:hypothetical protein